MDTQIPTSITTAEARTASDKSSKEGRNNMMDQDRYDDEYLRSVQEGLERLLEELLKEEEHSGD